MQEEDEDKILACVDRSHFADHVTDAAAWAARRTGAPLELMHIITRHTETASGSDRSGAIGFNAQQHLLTKLSEQDEARSKRPHWRGSTREPSASAAYVATHWTPSVSTRIRPWSFARTARRSASWNAGSADSVDRCGSTAA